uniref:Cytolysin Src1like [Maylandia zebra] n=1 Tax=Lepeophtheirus salmonis TaxID=72036 RepID=A0A0K2TKX4_LEPSM
MTSSLHTSFLIFLTLVSSNGASEDMQRDLVSSFLSKPWLLSNLSYMDLPASQNHLVTLTVSIDNWTPYVMSVGLGSNQLNTFIPVRNIDPLDRTFATRTAGNKQTNGLAGWHIIDPSKNGEQVGRVTLAWRASKKVLKFGVVIGSDFLDSVDGILEDGDFVNDRFTLSSFKGLTKDPIIVKRDNILVVLESKKIGKHNDFLLKVTILLPNVDVWWWKKYYGEKKESFSTTTTVSPMIKEFKIPNKSPYREEERRKRRKEDDSSIAPIFERKDLLPPISLIKSLNVSDAREALLSETRAYWIALGLQMENWSRRKLVEMSRQFESGKVFRNIPKVLPGDRELAIITHEEGSLSGTLGLIRYKIEPFDSILSIMWSVPYNRQLWKSWAAIGLSSTANVPSIEEMYSGTDPKRFIREKAGRRFEFSDGKRFLVSAEMDGGLTYKPILKVCFVPYERRELANKVKKQLGIPLHKTEDLSDPPPQIRLVQSSSNSISPLVLRWRAISSITLMSYFISSQNFFLYS